MRKKEYLKLLFGFTNTKRAVWDLKKRIVDMYNNENVFILENGRTAIYLFLKSLHLPRNSKVAIQAFTCNAVPNPVLWADLDPLYIDIDPKNFSMSLADLKQKNKGDIKVLILQHTFGLEADREIVRYCKEKEIIVLEDCAHCLGNTRVGNWGDASMISFGVEKILSSRVGGALIVNNKELLESIGREVEDLKSISIWETTLWILNPILWRLLRKLPGWIRKVKTKILLSFKLLNSGFASSENIGIKPSPYPRALSGKLAIIVLDCLTSLESNLGHRKEISGVYSKNISQKFLGFLIRYPYVAKDEETAGKIIKEIAKLGYPLFEKWYFPVVYPKSTSLPYMRYVKKSCPVAEEISANIVNLPTSSSVSKEDALKIANIVNTY